MEIAANKQDIQNDIADLREALSVTSDPDRKAKFENKIAELEALLSTELIEPEINKAEIEIKHPETSNWFISDNWFTENPDKILGDIVIEMDRYGKEFNSVKGNITNIEKIQVNAVFSADENNTPATASKENLNPEKEAEKPENQSPIDAIIAASEKNVAQKTIKKKAKAVELGSDEIQTIAQLQDLKYIWQKYNPDISADEFDVFCWYKQRIGHPVSVKWSNLLNWMKKEEDTYLSKEGLESKIHNWVKSGLVYYYKGELLPAYLYLAENVYEKIDSLNDKSENSDAKHIIDTYGQSVYDNQLSKLNEVYRTLFENRLKISQTKGGNELILNPISRISREFTLSMFNDELPFKMLKSGRKDSLGLPDFEKYIGYVSQYKENEFTSLTLQQAFVYWLIKYPSFYEIKQKTDWKEIYKIYIKQGQMPRVQEGEDKKAAQAEWERSKARAKEEGDRLFNQFVAQMLLPEDIAKLEMAWNSKYMNYVPINYNKVPVLIQFAQEYRGEVVDFRDEKREAVSFLFNEGAGCLAYDVGVGKTFAAIFSIEQFITAGYCSRPFIVVPNQTYKQWLSEIKGILPHRKINDLYNLSAEYIADLKDENGNVIPVSENSISVLTYEGFENLGFNQTTEDKLFSNLYDILNQGGESEADPSSKKSQKKIEGFMERLRGILGRSLSGSMVNIEDLGFDFITFDEAHNCKKIFTRIKGEAEESEDGKTKRNKTQYKISSGEPSTRGLKAFCIAQYILENNKDRNVVLLTATPFTNSPLEIFSMLALIAYKKLKDTDLNNIVTFFDNFISTSYELTINARLKPVWKQVIKGFNNLSGLQLITRRFFNYKTGDDVKVIRPNKIVLPMSKKIVDGIAVELSEKERVDTLIQMTEEQKAMMDSIIEYAEGKRSEGSLMAGGLMSLEDTFDVGNDNSEDAIFDIDITELDEDTLSNDEKSGVRTLKAMSHARNLALSPYLYKFSGLPKPSFKDYIINSPKLLYIMECIKSVKKYHEEHSEPVSGQIIYMDRGLEYFPLIADYLIHEIGYKKHEIGLIYSKTKKEEKSAIQNSFLGMKFNNATKMFDNISDEERIKVVIGSSTIKEGMNLQKKTTVLYDCWLDWNPTDFVQLCGRCHRQGNEFMNVRIVLPLVSDSMDIFILQKLEEKTARINTLWSSTGKSVLKIDELDPEEQKMAIVRDPRILAHIMVENDSKKIQDQLSSLDFEIKRVERIKESYVESQSRAEDIDKIIAEYRPKKANVPLLQKIKEIEALYKNQLDENGKKMYHSWEKNYLTDKERENISPKDKYSQSYWFTGFSSAVKTFEKEKREYLQPKGISESNLDLQLKKLTNQKEDLQEAVKKILSEENIKLRVEEIIEERARKHITYKEVPKLVEEFASLNNILSIKRSKAPKKTEEQTVCMLTDNGERRIDPEAIAHLENCLQGIISTKERNIDENGEYTPDRKLLHEKIIKKYEANKHCITSDLDIKPIAILSGGSPASGKTTFLKTFSKYWSSDRVYKIDADDIRAEFPENKGWNSTATHSETKDIVKYLLSNENIGQPCRYDLIYDGTMNSPKNYLPLIGILKNMGYEVYIIYMDNIPYDEIRRRALTRYQKTGRYVPISVIDDFFMKGTIALNQLKEKVDGYLVIDGSSKEYEVIEKGGKEIPTDRNIGKLMTDGGRKTAYQEMEDMEISETSANTTQEYEDIIFTYTSLLDEILMPGERQEYEDIIFTYKELLNDIKKVDPVKEIKEKPLAKVEPSCQTCQN
jgi:predicted ABC-type ATPase